MTALENSTLVRRQLIVHKNWFLSTMSCIQPFHSENMFFLVYSRRAKYYKSMALWLIDSLWNLIIISSKLQFILEVIIRIIITISFIVFNCFLNPNRLLFNWRANSNSPFCHKSTIGQKQLLRRWPNNFIHIL